MLLQPGQVFAGYTILRVLGAGGMGKVYLATHPRLPREDALKVLPAEFTDDAEYRARFTREADLAASLSHPHIVSIHDRGEHDGQFWISMDYVAGTDAARLLAERYQAGMPADEVAAIVTAVASALDYAHHRGLLHRDVKPANILLTDPDAHARRIYLADFGVARRIDDSAKLTATNVAVGTVAYAAPEQLRGHTIDGRADQYALACSAFELLTGTPPYTDPNPTVVIAQHVSAPPPSIATRRPELAHLDPIFTTALAKDPNDRYPTCTDFATQLTTHLYEDTRITQPAIAITAPVQRAPHRKRLTQRPAVVIAALVAVALVVIGAVFAGVRLNQSHDRATPAPPTVTTTAAPPPTSTAVAAPATPPPPPLPAFTGTYAVEFGPLTDLDGNPGGNGKSITLTYGLRSACGSTGCVATAARRDGDPTLAATTVFDQIDGNWVAVSLSSDQCQGTRAEFWQVFVVHPAPDGTLTGEFSRTSGSTCRDKRTVTFTRTGDVDVNTVADPAGAPPRVTSPAAALHGHYRVVRSFSSEQPRQTGESNVVTQCLRTGERCMSYFHGRAGDSPLLFANGIWTLDTEQDYRCPAGGTTHFSVIAQFPLPASADDPITSLIGHGHQEQTGACAVNTGFEQTFTRIGD
ncbi:hypothetical protein MKUB_43140 [Mycobacterium kubicae]|uniref:non-specific serine/threonine protein kinase n=3 Tax=Mycobacterium kubicae TaxID=120959 RepID=A0AAX1J6I7_9MYCO|nr:serine/threonine-protein kinase [Mycobacterium kubicae]QNI13586.1 serine/threonine protein kinase [Mycobacterium kubicae]QPI37104.1 serine/threonine protein kinase [Mycobacterium kubicae]GFG66824.1 hypothetical protein MKUB_43140 [Mycobacterium kubicae]